jgi:hypothetical protein
MTLSFIVGRTQCRDVNCCHFKFKLTSSPFPGLWCLGTRVTSFHFRWLTLKRMWKKVPLRCATSQTPKIMDILDWIPPPFLLCAATCSFITSNLKSSTDCENVFPCITIMHACFLGGSAPLNLEPSAPPPTPHPHTHPSNPEMDDHDFSII